MIITEQRFTRSEKIVWETGFIALTQALGYADTLRFLTQLSSGQGDYLEWQNQIFGEANPDEIYEQAKKYWTQRDS